MSYTLRDLPLPVKVVATVFLLAVGSGYLSAMVQLHMQDSKSGKPMPTVADVVFKYTGKKKLDGPPPAPVSQLEALVMGPIEGAPWNGTGSMAPAFYHKDASYAREVEANPADRPRIDAERDGERELVRWWIRAAAEARKQMYQDDKCTIAAEKAPKQITGRFKAADGTFKIKSLLDARCARCHSQDGSEPGFPLETYEQLEKYMTVPPAVDTPPGGWAKVGTPVSLEKLTQSTHAHLLSFAVLFSLTGLVFALSSYPTGLRCVLGPWVVIAVFADVSLWWLARLSDQWGPYFAMGIIATGGLAGAGLFGQIVLSLFNMYGRTGKIVMGAVFAIGLGVVGAVWVSKIDPALAAKSQPTDPPKKVEPQPAAPKDGDKKATEPPKVDGKDKKVETPAVPPSMMEKLLTFPVKGPDGKILSMEETPWAGGDDGNMARAFYDKDKAFKEFMAGDAAQPAKDTFMAERDGERLALIAWIRATDAPRKAAYDADAFPLPPDLTGKPLTSKYAKDGKVSVKSIIADRCLRCHGEGGKQYDDYPLDTYDALKKYLNADPPAPGAPPKGETPTVAPAPKPANPIPAAKDD